jgi:antitoxin component YwqK of YwqJK toxin-antitoxin module
VTALLLAMLACPPGAAEVGAAPPDGFELACEREGATGPDRREGPFRAWYDDGALAREAGYRAGRLHGKYVEYHRGGKRAREGEYSDGERVGTWRFYFEDGKLEEECAYAKGERHGPFASFHPNGKRKTAGRYCHGLQCGTWTTWAEDGAELGKVDYGEVRLVP